MGTIFDKTEAIVGCLLGTAVGDAIALPGEGLSKHRLRKFYPHLDRHHFFFGNGMISDDTEQTCIVAQSLIISAGDERLFARQLAWRLKLWLLGIPAGIGLATLSAILKLWLGFPPHRSGIFSAGNGPATRSAILGVCYGNNLAKLRSLVRISTRITHSDPKAEYGALAVAIAAYLASQKSPVRPQDYYRTLQQFLPEEAAEFLALIQQVCHSLLTGQTAEDFSATIGKSQGVSGYIYHTVPVVIQVWLNHQQNYQSAIQEIVFLGGDTDTTAAILGGIIGAAVGKSGLPKPWLDNVWEWPRTVPWIEAVGQRLAEGGERPSSQAVVPLASWGILLRNLVFLAIVISHVIRRLFPPY